MIPGCAAYPAPVVRRYYAVLWRGSLVFKDRYPLLFNTAKQAKAAVRDGFGDAVGKVDALFAKAEKPA